MFGWRSGLLCFVLSSLTGNVRARIGTFWHVTDFHYDVNYTINGDNAHLCWTKRPGEMMEGSKAGQFGDFECDAPRALLEAAVKGMARLHPDPDFVMWTGDYTAHVPHEFFSTEIVMSIIGNLTDIFKTHFPATPFVPLLGNHDFYPKDQIPPGQTEIQTRVADLWRDWLPGDEFNTFSTDGRYIRDLPNSLVTVVVMNTLQWYAHNEFAASLSDEDVGGHFQWTNDVLTQLAERGRRVFLVGHVPQQGIFFKKPSTSYQDKVNKRFIKLVRDHANVIEAQFFAHQHTDSFRLVFSEGGEVPVSYQLVAPAVTPWPAHNPAIRLVSYDTETGKLKELSTYYLDLRQANMKDMAEWQLEYNFTSAYNLPEISPASLHSLTEAMKTNTSLFDHYYKLNTVGLAGPGDCTDECRRLYLCTITKVDYEEMQICNSAISKPPMIPASKPPITPSSSYSNPGSSSAATTAGWTLASLLALALVVALG